MKRTTRTLIVVILSGLFSLLVMSPAISATYYVDGQNGNDTANNGNKLDKRRTDHTGWYK